MVDHALTYLHFDKLYGYLAYIAVLKSAQPQAISTIQAMLGVWISIVFEALFPFVNKPFLYIIVVFNYSKK